MARRREFNGLIRTRAYWLWLTGVSHREIRETLDSEYTPSPSIRTIARMVSEFKELGSKIRALEAPWIWTMQDDVIPADGARVILDTSAYVIDFGPSYLDPPFRPGFPDPVMPLTLREARWVWRVRSAASDLTLHDNWLLAEEFAVRERVHDVSRSDVGFIESGAVDGLLCLLRFAPWRSAANKIQYDQMVHAERVVVPKPLQPFSASYEEISAIHSKIRRPNPPGVSPMPLQPGDYGMMAMMAGYVDVTLQAALRREGK